MAGGAQFTAGAIVCAPTQSRQVPWQGQVGQAGHGFAGVSISTKSRTDSRAVFRQWSCECDRQLSCRGAVQSTELSPSIKQGQSQRWECAYPGALESNTPIMSTPIDCRKLGNIENRFGTDDSRTLMTHNLSLFYTLSTVFGKNFGLRRLFPIVSTCQSLPVARLGQRVELLWCWPSVIVDEFQDCLAVLVIGLRSCFWTVRE